MTTTPRLGLPLPKGSDQITTISTGPHDIRAIASALDGAAVWGASVHSLRPAASLAGRLWLSTDTLALAIDTGSAWVTLARLPITADQVGALAITVSKIATGAVTTDKISTGAVTANKISTGAVTTDKIAPAAVTADKIGGSAVTTPKIAAGAVGPTQTAQPTVADITPSAGWSSGAGGMHNAVAFAHQTHLYRLRGVLRGSPTGLGGPWHVIGTVPAGYRPWAGEMFPVAARWLSAPAEPVPAMLFIHPDGVMNLALGRIVFGDVCEVSLSGIVLAG